MAACTLGGLPLRESASCTVGGCPERHRCLDLDRPTHCPLYRALQEKNLPCVKDKGKVVKHSEREELQ